MSQKRYVVIAYKPENQKKHLVISDGDEFYSSREDARYAELERKYADVFEDTKIVKIHRGEEPDLSDLERINITTSTPEQRKAISKLLLIERQQRFEEKEK